jgi:primase-polymerase (primpol)-like protein
MRECGTCGRSIVAKNAQARYCGTKCRVSAHRSQKANPIPAEMLNARRWIRRTATKTPLTIHGTAASSTNPQTWATHAEAVTSTAGVGLGFTLGDGFACIDLDHCLRDGTPTAEAAAMISRYPANYIEVSPSGDGLHIWGTMPEQPGTRRVIQGLNVETYSVGRYITVTGHVYQHGTLAAL